MDTTNTSNLPNVSLLLRGCKLNADWLVIASPEFRGVTQRLKMRPRRAIIALLVLNMGKGKSYGISLRDIASYTDVSFGEIMAFCKEFHWLDVRGYIVEIEEHKRPLSQKQYKAGDRLIALLNY